MTANTSLLHYQIDPSSLEKDEVWDALKGIGCIVLSKLKTDPLVLTLDGDHNKLMIFQGPCSSGGILGIYIRHQILTDVYGRQILMSQIDPRTKLPVASLYNQNTSKASFSEEYTRALHDKIKHHLGKMCLNSECLLTPVKRGQSVWPYVITSDERLIEQDFSNVTFDEVSEWQHVRIVCSKQWGNTLYLDNDAMLAESDYIYTKMVCKLGEEDYENKDILILGGGDGGILHELLKYKPQHILMVEIDKVVIEACRTHMRSVCGSSMDHYEGPNHKIMIADCVEVLHECILSERTFDYVINDLTELPVDKQSKGYTYDYLTTNLITESSLKVLKPTGKILARGNCIGATAYRDRLERDLTTLGCNFIVRKAFVPSFCELYSFYEITKPAVNGVPEA